MHIIAAKAQCFEEAMTDEFREYITNVINNTEICKNKLAALGATVSGTDNHLFLLDTVTSYGLTGLEAQKLLEEAGITTNKNMLPNDKLKPNETSGLRIGFAAVTTRGCTADDARFIAEQIHNVLKNYESTYQVKMKVERFTTNCWKNIEKI